MILFTTIVSTDAARIGRPCVENMEKPSAFTQIHPHSNDFSSHMDQHGVKLAGVASERACFGKLGLSEKSICRDSRLTHRPTNRMILTSLVFVLN